MELTFEISFTGSTADDARLQFYDAAQALEGWERVISLTSHLLLNGEVRTQSPSVRGFQLVMMPPEEGSWKVIAGLALATLEIFGNAPRDSINGWIAHSAVEFVLQASIGMTPDFDRTLGPQLAEHLSKKKFPVIAPNLTEERFDSLMEKCEDGIRAIHRPIVNSGSAKEAKISTGMAGVRKDMNVLIDRNSYLYVSQTINRDDLVEINGVISSYNVNTFNGRIYVYQLDRTIPFSLTPQAVNPRSIQMILSSLQKNGVALSRKINSFQGDISLQGYRQESLHGRLKKFLVVDVGPVRT